MKLFIRERRRAVKKTRVQQVKEDSLLHSSVTFDLPKQCIVNVVPSSVLVHVVRSVQHQDVSCGNVAHVSDVTCLPRLGHVCPASVGHVTCHDV